MAGRVVTLVFTDLVGSTALKAQLPGGDVTERNRVFIETILTPHRERVQAALPARGGRVIKTEGDAFFLVFDDPVEAVRWAADLQLNHTVEPIATPAGPLRVRVGINTGSPVAVGDDFIGREVDCAARLTALAAGGQIVLSEATAALVRAAAPEGLSVHAHGPRDLKGLGRVPVFELLYAGRGPMPLQAPALSPANLPPAETLVGRDDLLALLRESLDRGGVTILKGEGGIGKTAAALAAVHAAHRDRQLPGGAVWINCELAPSADECLRQMAAVFFDDRMEGDDAARCRERVAGHLREHRAAVVFDNFETVAGNADLRRWIATVRPPAWVLVTTRDVPPGLTGRVIEVGELPREQAVALFIERASAAGAVTDGQEQTIRDLCAVVGDLPLAIELLAARRLPLPRLLDRVRRDLAILDARGDPTRPGRHQSLAACVAVSVEHLSAPARDLLLRLSILPDGAGADVITAVVGNDDWDEAAEELVQASVWRLKGERYVSHPLVRHFALERLGDARRGTERRTVEAVARLAADRGQETEPGAADPDTMVGALDWIETEWRNLLACAETAFAAEDWSLVGAIADAVRFFYLVRGHWRESEHLLRRALEARRRSGDRHGEAMTLNGLGSVAYYLSRFDDAEAAYLACLPIRRQVGDRDGEGKTLNNLGIVYAVQGRWTEAERCYRESLAIWRDLDDPAGQATALASLANVHYSQSRWAEAEAACSDALAIWRAIGDRLGESKTLGNLGHVFLAQKRWDEAEDAYTKSLTLRRQLGDRAAEGAALSSLAELYAARGDLPRALDAARQGVEVLTGTEAAPALQDAARQLADLQRRAAHAE